MTGQFIVHDPYFKKAKALGYRARSAFKLLEIEEKYHLIHPGMKVLDLASAPWSFLQVIARLIGERGRGVGIDIQKIAPFSEWNITLFQADIFDTPRITSFLHTLGISTFDLITSDIAPSTTGMTGVDQYRSIELNMAILDIAESYLKVGWNLLLKVFVWEDINDLIIPIKQRYEKLSRFKPRACRDRSFEEYFICLGKK